MSEDTEKIEAPIRALEYMIENPKKVVRMDPDQGGNRGFNGALTDRGTPPKQQDQEPEPPANTTPIVQPLDTVILSPAAQQATIKPPTGAAPKPEPSPAPAPSGKPSVLSHVDLTA